MLVFVAVLATSPRGGLEVTGAAQFTLPVPGYGLRSVSPLYVSVPQLLQAEGSGPGLKSFTGGPEEATAAMAPTSLTLSPGQAF